MKSRVLVIVLLVALCCLGCVLFLVSRKNVTLRKKYNDVQEIIRQNEIDKEIYLNKSRELDELKEKNSDKILKYEEVEKWNQEIMDYLD